MPKTPKYGATKFAPETLSVRKKAKHNRFESSGAMPTTIDGVSVVMSDSERSHMYSAPQTDGAEFRRLRRLGLLLSRYGLVDKNKFAKKKDLPVEVVTCAERIVAMSAYKDIYGGDPTIGTTNLVPLATMLNGKNCPPSALAHALSYANTAAFPQLMNLVTNPEVRTDLEDIATRYLSETRTTSISQNIRGHINTAGNSASRYSNSEYERLSQVLMKAVDATESRQKAREEAEAQSEAERQRKLRGNDKYKRHATDKLEGKRYVQPGQPVLREIVPSIEGWCLSLLEKMPLTLPHTGRKGRKLIPMPYGKSIRFIAREDTDPEQRVFSRKTRSKGGIVVVDCSGSMSFDDSDLDRIMAATAGATVICYSSGNEDYTPPQANIWLVAHNGRRTSRLPSFPGNNGVDGPALEYGLSLRKHNEPVVWITDTRVTGTNDTASEDLRDWCLAYCERHSIYITPDSYTATNLLAKIQQGKKPRINKFRRGEQGGYQNYE